MAVSCGIKGCMKCSLPPRCPYGPKCVRCYPKRYQPLTKYELDRRRGK